jgi:predicted MPP superfamily phosphohydrolase
LRTTGFIIFFAIFLALYGLINYYIFIRGWQALPHGSAIRKYFIVAFLFVAASFIVGRFLERLYLSWLSDIIVWVGSFWLAAMLYFVLIILILDLARLVHSILPFFPSLVTLNYVRAKQVTMLVAVGIVAIALLAGHINAVTPHIKKLELDIPKSANGRQTLYVVSASDIHLGTIVGRGRFEKAVRIINDLKPDLILLPGDIVDEDLAPVIRENIGESLRNLRAPLGVFAATGNHEYIGGVTAAAHYLTDHDITLLRDSVARVDNAFYIVGREDRAIRAFTGGNRVSLDTLLEQVDMRLPVILMDHQPFELDQASSLGVDLQISGHTHHGQIWPLNYITQAVYEVSWGYKRKDNTHYYVSSGLGSWGPPVRIGNHPEIVQIKLNFTG